MQIYEKMLREFIILTIILAVAVALLAIRLLLGKKNFIHTHVEGNKEMKRRGIGCVKQQDREARLRGGLRIKEHSAKSQA